MHIDLNKIPSWALESSPKKIATRLCVRNFVNNEKVVKGYLNTPLKQRNDLVRKRAQTVIRIKEEMEKDSFKEKSLISKVIKIVLMFFKAAFEEKKIVKQFIANT